MSSDRVTAGASERTGDRLRSLTALSLLALATGFAAGAALHGVRSPSLQNAAANLEMLGTLWTNALRMTVIPLVVSQLVLAVTMRTGAGALGQLGTKTLTVMVGMLLAAAAFGLMVTPAVLGYLPVEGAVLEGLFSSGAHGESARSYVPPDLREWIPSLVPANPIAAAADGAVLPIIIFTLTFAAALTRVAHEWRAPLEHLARAVSEVMLVVVRWVLLLTPVGVFALAMAMSRQAGLEAVSAVAYFIVLVSAELVAFTLLIYLVAMLGGRLSLSTFSHAVAPAQLVAISTRSSLASLPALLEGAEKRLAMPTGVAGFVLPISVASFKLSVVLANLVTGLFLASLYGIELSATDMATLAVTLILVSFGAPGIPSLGVTALPAFVAVGIPIEGVLLLHAVDLVPDIFKTLLNVTGDMGLAAVVNRWTSAAPPLPGAEEPS